MSTQRIVTEAAINSFSERGASNWLFESSPDCVKLLNLDGSLVAMNHNGLCSMEIEDFSTLCGVPWRSFWDASMHSTIESALVTAREGGTGHFNAFGATMKGTPKWWDVMITPVRECDGRIVQLLSVSRDVTEVHRAREKAEASEARFRAVVRAVSAIVWVMPPSCMFESEQPEWSSFTGQSYDQLQGAGWLEAVHDADRDATLQAVLQARQILTPYTIEHRLRRADGQYRYMSVQVAPVLGTDGMLREWFGVHTDITDRKNAEAALHRSTGEIAEADRRKTEFILTLAHELRNPLAPISSGLQVLKLAADNPATVARVRGVMERQVGQMVRLIDDLLDVARISRGQVKLKKELIDLKEIAATAVEMSLPHIEAGNHELTVDFPGEPLPLLADPIRVAQVLSNLLNNAAKYSPPQGAVRLSAVRDADDIVVTVADRGIGIPAESLPHVFDLFTQVEQHRERSQGGLGIGLSLVRNLVQLHGGTASVSSAGVGMGSSFVVRLPVASQR